MSRETERTTGRSPQHKADSVELLSRFAAGDASALSRLVVQEGKTLIPYIERRLPRYLRRRLGASDILQNTVVDLIRVRERFENRGVPAFRKLLRVMADLNLARAVERERAQRRDVTKEQTPGSQLDLEEDGSNRRAKTKTPSAQLRFAEDRAQLERALRQLSSTDRQLLRWVDFDNLSHGQVAERLAITEIAARNGIVVPSPNSGNCCVPEENRSKYHQSTLSISLLHRWSPSGTFVPTSRS